MKSRQTSTRMCSDSSPSDPLLALHDEEITDVEKKLAGSKNLLPVLVFIVRSESEVLEMRGI